jgi:hypothetical protein
VLSWFYGRILVPICTYLPLGIVLYVEDWGLTYGRAAGACIWGCIFCLVGMYVLWILNVYWFIVMLNIGVEKLMTGKFVSKHEGENLNKDKTE